METNPEKVLPLYSVFFKKPDKFTLIALPTLSSILLPFFPIFLIQIILFSVISRNCTKYFFINALQNNIQYSFLKLYLISAAYSILSMLIVTLISYFISNGAELISPMAIPAYAMFSIPLALISSALLPNKIKKEISSGKTFRG